jgi:hypothetical protein
MTSASTSRVKPKVSLLEIVRDEVSGLYRAKSRRPGTGNVYTVFVKFSRDEVEEIDVVAGSIDGAKDVARVALLQDYDLGGKIARVILRPKSAMFL